MLLLMYVNFNIATFGERGLVILVFKTVVFVYSWYIGDVISRFES